MPTRKRRVTLAILLGLTAALLPWQSNWAQGQEVGEPAKVSWQVTPNQPDRTRQESRDDHSGKEPAETRGATDHDDRIEAGSFPKKLTAQHLPNPVQVHRKVISGGLPEGDAAFRELQSLGVKTVISVDGMKPDIALAAKHGLRYVHLPHGYDGVPRHRAEELAKAVRDLDGPIYIHCHHGRHRSPAAASVACVMAGLIPESKSVRILELAGTSPSYRGLFASARNATPLTEAMLDELEVEFPETANVPPLAEAMVAMGHTHDHLKRIAESGWRSPPDHPDLDPAHEALLMRQHFTELLRTDLVQQEPEGFRLLLRDSEEAAKALEDALRTWNPESPEQANPTPIMGRLSARISDNCKACHVKYRDIPLGEKQ